MLNEWKTSAMEILRLVAGSPETTTGLVILTVSGLVAFVAVVRFATAGFRLPMSDMGRALQATILCTLCLLAVAVAAELHIAPRIAGSTLKRFVPLIAAVVAVPALAVPIMRLIHRGNYLQSLLVVILAIAGTAAMVLLIHAAFDAAASGGRRSKKLKNRKDEIEHFMPRNAPTDREPVGLVAVLTGSRRPVRVAPWNTVEYC